MQHHTHIQAVHVLEVETQIVFGDDMFVSFDTAGELLAVGMVDGRRVAIAEGESRQAFANRATDDQANLGAYSPAIMLARIAYCEPILEQPWIEAKRVKLFG